MVGRGMDELGPGIDVCFSFRQKEYRLAGWLAGWLASVPVVAEDV
jgi:hypothetical protein